MRRLLVLPFIVAILQAQNPNAAVFPAAVATDNNLLVATNNADSTLAGGVSAAATTIFINIFNKFVTPLVITVDGEVMYCPTHSAGGYTCQRGFDGTTAIPHNAGVPVHGYSVAWHHNQVAAEVKAIENALGPGLSNVVAASGVPVSASVLSSNGSRQITAAPVTGAGSVVLAISPTLVTPNLGMPSTLNLGNATGLPCAAMPALTGDTTTVAGTCATTTATINGGAVPTSAALLGTDGASRFTKATAHALAVSISCLDASGSPTAQSCTTSPTFIPAAGDTITYKTTTTNTGDLTINVNASTPVHARKWQGASTLAAGDLVAGVYMLATYDGTFWQFYTIGNAPSGGGGMGCNPAGSNTSILTDNGSGGCTSNTGATYSSGILSIGTIGSLVGSLRLANITSGTVTLQPVTGALGSAVISVPAVTDTLVTLAAIQTLSNKTLVAPALGTPVSGNMTNVTGLPLNSGVVGQLPLANGGTNANLTASNGGVFYSGASGGAILAGTATAGLPLLSGATAAPSWGSAPVAQKFFGTAAPGSVTGNLPGDFYSDTANHKEYWCNAPATTAAPACTSVTSGGWTLANGPYQAGSYNFPPQTPGGSISIGSNTITLTPCPAGVGGADIGHYLYLSGGTGTAEPVNITGGTCASGAATGTVIVTAAHTHTGGWTVSPASFGWQEAINGACLAGGGTVNIGPGNFVLLGTVTITCSAIIVQGGGGMCCGLATWIHRTGDFGDSLVLGSTSLQVNSINLYDFALTYDLNYVSGNPGTITSKPTSGANIRIWGSNTVNMQRLRLENMVQNVIITGAPNVTIRDCQFVGLFDAVTPALQVTVTSVYVNEAATGVGASIPTYVSLINNYFLGNATGTGTFNGAGPRQMVQFSACEDCYIEGGSMGAAAVDNVIIAPTNPYPLLNIRIHNVKFDSAGVADVEILSDSLVTAQNIQITDCDFNGEGQGINGIFVANVGSGVPAVQSLILSNNVFWAYISTPVNIVDGAGFTFSGNSIRYYNINNTFSTQAGSSGMYFSGRANHGMITGNDVGGGRAYEPWNTGTNFTNYGITLQAGGGAQANIHLAVNNCDLVQHTGTC